MEIYISRQGQLILQQKVISSYSGFIHNQFGRILEYDWGGDCFSVRCTENSVPATDIGL